MNLAMSFIRKLSLKKKIRAITFICIALLASVSFLIIFLISSAYKKVLYQSAASTLSYSSRELEFSLMNIDTMADMIMGDTAIQKNLSLLASTNAAVLRAPAAQGLYTSLNEYYFNFRKSQIRYMSLYQNNFSTHTYQATINRLPDHVTKDLIAQAEAAHGATVWVTDYAPEYGLFMVKELRQIEFLKLDSIGVLVINVDIQTLMNRATATGQTLEQAHYLLHNRGNLIYNSDLLNKEGYDAALSLVASTPDRYGLLKRDKEELFYVHNTLPELGWDYICTIPYGSIADSLAVSRNMCLTITVLAIMLSVFLSSRLTDSITRHFDVLVTKMHNFGDGNYIHMVPNHDYDDRTDEIGILHTQFDLMVDQVNELIRSNYLNELLRKDAQFKALESQMNPHFLYNTLESINWRAKALGARDISSMAESLGTLLRITLDQKTKQLPLYRELEVVQCYMIIQKFRYEERLQYDIIAPDHLLQYEVLKLTLQPLVENAIRYGLEENTETCRVQIIAEAQEQHLYLYVKNNGSYFDDDLLVKLKAQQVTPHGFGIGLLNIHERMQITYGDDYGLTLYNEEELAVARLDFPLPHPPYGSGLQKEDDTHAEINNC